MDGSVSIDKGPAMGATRPFNRPDAHLIRSDEEAIGIAKALAEDFRKEAGIRDAERRRPTSEINQYSQSGIWGMTVPRQYGGAGVSNVTLAEVCKIISEADPSIGQIPQNHFYMVEALRLDGDEWQKEYFFNLVLKGVRFGNAFSEIGTKSVEDVKTRLEPHNGAYLLSGKKFYCTGSVLADWVPVVAKNEHDKTCIAYVEKGIEGLEVIDDWSSFGQKTTCSGTTVLDKVLLPREHVIPHHLAFDRPTSMGPVAQIIQAAVDAGIAHAAFNDTCHFVRNYTRPWIDTTPKFEKGYEDTLIIRDIGDMKIRLLAMDALLRRAGEVLDRCQADPSEQSVAEASIAVGVAKAISTENSVAFSSKLFELAGTRSTLEEYHLDRHWRNARTHTLHDPVRWKYHSIGNYYLNGVLPPRNPWV